MERWTMPEPEDMLLKVGVIRVSDSQKILCYRDPAGLYFQNHINMNDSTLEGIRMELLDTRKIKLPPVVAADIHDFIESDDRLKFDRDEALERLFLKNYQLYNKTQATKEQEEIFIFISENLGLYCRAILGEYEVETEIDCAMRRFAKFRKGLLSPIDAVKVAAKNLPVEQHYDFIRRLASELQPVSPVKREDNSYDSN